MGSGEGKTGMLSPVELECCLILMLDVCKGGAGMLSSIFFFRKFVLDDPVRMS